MPPSSEATQDPLQDLPRDPTAISSWITREATVAVDPHRLMEGLGRMLNAAGVPVVRINIAAATLSTQHRGIDVTWWRERGVSIATVEHGAEGETAFGRSAVAALLADDLVFARWRIETGDGCNRIPTLEALRQQGCTDYLLDAVEFPPDTAIRGVGLSYATDRPGGFSESDVARIAEHRDALGLVVLRMSLSRSMHNLLGAYVGERTADRIMAGQVRRGQGELMEAAILLVDLKGFTAAADREDPLRLVGWLDEHLEALGRSVDCNGGEILKFTGDGFLAVFPVLQPGASPCRACEGALAAARAGLAHNRALEAERGAVGQPALAADLALHFGQVVYGNIGTANRLDFTAIGRAVNEASRIETLCDTTGRHILLSDSFARRCASGPIDLGLFPLRGVATPQRLWTVSEA